MHRESAPLRRRLTAQSPLPQADVQADQEAFQLKRATAICPLRSHAVPPERAAARSAPGRTGDLDRAPAALAASPAIGPEKVLQTRFWRVISQVVGIHPSAENASMGFLERVFLRSGRRCRKSRARWYGWGSSPPRLGSRSHERRRTPRATPHRDRGPRRPQRARPAAAPPPHLEAPASKAAVKAEQELFRLRRELQRLDLEDPE